MTSLFAVTFILHTAFVAVQSTSGTEIIEACNVYAKGAGGEISTLYSGSCKDVARAHIEDMKRGFPDVPFHIIVDGFDCNKV